MKTAAPELTRESIESIESMPAGPEMDALVAELIMGWKLWGYEAGHSARLCHPDFKLPLGSMWVGLEGRIVDRSDVPCYSSDIALATEVVEKLAAAGFHVLFDICDGTWGCDLRQEMESKPNSECTIAGVNAPTFPLAVCRAALIAGIGE